MSEPRHPVGPEIDDTANPTAVAPDEASPSADADASAGWASGAPSEPGAGEPGSAAPPPGAGEPAAGRGPVSGRDMLTQLQAMIDSLAVQATPVVREVAAKAAELAAVAGQKAGPLAHRAAEATEKVGERVAARSKEMAADLRRSKDAGEGEGGPGTETAEADFASPTTDYGSPERPAEGTVDRPTVTSENDKTGG